MRHRIRVLRTQTNSGSVLLPSVEACPNPLEKDNYVTVSHILSISYIFKLLINRDCRIIYIMNIFQS